LAELHDASFIENTKKGAFDRDVDAHATG